MVYLDGPRSVDPLIKLKDQLRHSANKIVYECRDLDNIMEETKPYLDEQSYKMILGILDVMDHNVKSVVENSRILYERIAQFDKILSNIHLKT